MTGSSNTTSFATLTADYPVVRIASGTAINTDTTVCTGLTNASVLTDILFRNVTGSTVTFDVFIGSPATTENNAVRVIIPASAGNNGTVALAQLSVLASPLFDLDLAGNRVLTLEPGVTIYVRNIAATSADVYVRAKRRNF